MVGRAATIRYNVSEHYISSAYTLRTAQDLLFVGAHSRVGDLVGLLVLRNVKVDPDEDLFALEGDVGDGELAREGHGD